ncbi:MAG: branched-chain amino acid ABC transporter permease [Bosea sp.]|nr:branched-chain amino acid ABC transporter permease [Bosea sp. (in: a-proteobacteria)]
MYAAIGIGLTLIFGVVRIVNFAHGSFLMAAAYCSWLLFDRFAIDPYASVLILVPAFFILGMVYYWTLLRPMVGTSLLAQSLLTIGVNLVIQNGALGLFGSQVKIVELPYTTESIAILGLTLPVTRLVAGAAGLLATVIMYFGLWKTGLGVAVRASASDRPIAEAMGINTYWAQSVVTGISLACVALGGAVLLPLYSASPAMATDFTFLSFQIIVLGGMGSFFGALVGGVLLGISESVGATFFDGSMGRMLTFVLFVLLLILRPNGILRGRPQ